MRGRGRRLLVLAAVLGLVAAACAQTTDDAEEATPATDEEAGIVIETEEVFEFTGERGTAGCETAGTLSAPQGEGFDLKIGLVTSFTGDLSDFGEPISEAAQLAVAQIEAAVEEAGLSDSVTVELETQDDQTSATAGVEAARQLVDAFGAQVIVGALASSVTTPIAESVTTPGGVVQISPASTSPALSALEDENLFWRTVPSDAIQGRVLAQAMASAFGQDATVNTGTRNDAYGTALTGVFEEAWRDQGGEIGRSVSWNPEAQTFDSEAQDLVSDGPEAWMIIDFPETFAKVGPALVRAGEWEAERTFTADGLRSSDLPNQVDEQVVLGMRGTAPSTEGAPAAEAFDALWEEEVEIDRQTFDAQTFDAVILAFLAAVAAGSSDSTAIAGALQAVSCPEGEQVTYENLGDAIAALQDGEDIDYEGVSGPINFDENGDPGPVAYEVWRFQEAGSD